MRRLVPVAALAVLAGGAWLLMKGCTNAPTPPPNPLDAQRAYAHVAAMVEIGHRPSGSPGLRECRDYIVAELEKIGFDKKKREVRVVSFEDPKNAPDITFHNIEVEIPGTDESDDRILVVGSHYDTKNPRVPDCPIPNMKFVGANDAGSSSGLLIELARYWKKNPLPCTLLLVWFDGEESIPWEWDDDKALFGSKYTVKRLRARFDKKRDLAQCVPVMVLLDMVGAVDLEITKDTNSNEELTKIVAETANSMGYGEYFFTKDNTLEVVDDHVPFRNVGIKVIDIIQFGGMGSRVSPWWHTDLDDIEIVSAKSLGIVGHVVIEALPKMAAKYYRK